MDSQDFSYVNRAYGVKFQRGTRIEFTGSSDGPKRGVIASSAGHRVNIRFDGERQDVGPFHPTWELRAIESEGAAA